MIHGEHAAYPRSESLPREAANPTRGEEKHETTELAEPELAEPEVEEPEVEEQLDSPFAFTIHKCACLQTSSRN